MQVAGEFFNVVLLIVLAVTTAAGILAVSSLIGPKRKGPRKHSTYESGMEPVGDTRRRFSVKFYLVAVLFLIFDVELLVLYPWAVMIWPLNNPRPDQQVWAQTMIESGYSPVFLLGGVGVFFALLLVGFIYEWRRGVFQWN
jgi:NADH-quinone oxidoreductase subunit A